MTICSPARDFRASTTTANTTTIRSRRPMRCSTWARLRRSLCMASYAWARMHPVKNPQTFEDWVSNQFGHRLFSIFFKTYTEKVWGMSSKELSADWAAQRIKGLDLGKAIRSALLPRRKSRSRSGHQDAHRRVSLSAPRTRPNVGANCVSTCSSRATLCEWAKMSSQSAVTWRSGDEHRGARWRRRRERTALGPTTSPRYPSGS